MRSIFHGRKTLARLTLFATLGLAIFGSVSLYLSAHGHEIGASNMQLHEHIELDAKAPFVYKKYTGPQNAQELMKALDANYNQSLAKTSVSVSGKFTAKTTNAGKVTGPKTTTYSSDLTLSEIDARYPRAEWLQLFLDKGITIDDSFEYASVLSKRYTLALLEDNPDLQQSGFLGIPPTDGWETYKAAYIDKLVNDHTKIQASAEQIERGKKTIERAKVRIEQRKEHAKLAIERSKEAIERANAQLERGTEQLKHAKAQIEQSKKDAKLAIERSKDAVERAKAQIQHSKAQIERAMTQLERAKKELNSQQLVDLRKQIEGIQETLTAPKKPTPPQEPMSPQGSN
ncbi:MAG: hypothetical protein OXI61_02395 [Candidatus Poribacteria bacterium]|nr:hypothetical protein [Candidatus Poribacteria bacterium]